MLAVAENRQSIDLMQARLAVPLCQRRRLLAACMHFIISNWWHTEAQKQGFIPVNKSFMSLTPHHVEPCRNGVVPFAVTAGAELAAVEGGIHLLTAYIVTCHLLCTFAHVRRQERLAQIATQPRKPLLCDNQVPIVMKLAIILCHLWQERLARTAPLP